ncbi:MAG: YbgA family protein [Syntrophales bacterium]
MDKIRLGISACLLGKKVRYDGGHKLDSFLTDTMGRFVEFIPVCPEVEMGLGVPRESMRLHGDPASPRLITSKTNRDYTGRMCKWAEKRVRELEREDLSGFIFKSHSPSSGMRGVRVYDENGKPVKKGAGIFAGVFMTRFPLLPVEDEGRLHNPAVRENFIERIFTMKRWRRTLAERKRLQDLVDFHTRHKLLILAHSERHVRLMDRLIAQGTGLPPEELYGRYQGLLMEAVLLNATTRKNYNVLQHATGFFKKQLPSEEEKELFEIVDLYRRGRCPLVVPLTLLRHYAYKYDQPYLKEQFYLNPHPIELQLRNHA